MMCVWTKPVWGQACPEATQLRSVTPLPAAWQAALDALMEAASTQGALWSCSGARISVEIDPSGDAATLRVVGRDGRVVERAVPSPDDLVSMGEALLAAPPRAGPKEAPMADEPPIPEAAVVPEAMLRDAREPRVSLMAALGARYAGPTRVVWGSGAVGAWIPFEDWSAGLWIRGDLPSWLIDETTTDLSMTEICVGLLKRSPTRRSSLRLRMETSAR